jgi:hypothetical protein
MMMPVAAIVVMHVMLILVATVPCVVVVIKPAMAISAFVDNLDAWPKNQRGPSYHYRGRAEQHHRRPGGLRRGNHAARDQNDERHTTNTDRGKPRERCRPL